MSLLTDGQIKDLAVKSEMISPFLDSQLNTLEIDGVERRVPSFGLSAVGYDVRLQPMFKLAKMTTVTRDLLEPNVEDWYTTIEDDNVVIPPQGFVLATTLEYFKLPQFVMASAFCKSTLARRGLNLPPTIAEPGWKGNLVLEIFNKNPFPIRIYSGIGFAQMIFFVTGGRVLNPYGEGRKYQGQTGITLGLL